MVIYTKKGDKGTTKLPYDTRKRSKSHCRVRSLGEIDELNSAIGAACAFTKEKGVRDMLAQVQHDLFRVQMDLASKGAVFKEKSIKPIADQKVKWLEKRIDEMQEKLTPLSTFILPGGSPAGALAQLSRAICRRAERELAALRKKEKVNPEVVKYINRLSDFLFVIARFINKKEGEKETHPDYYKK
ncbi:MAG: cob(I)yrinic acid a,c-diamide adenosyltransferase [Candidatus Portnoybacteria bacterium]|nr:cob(I)yrinic acid a,c-diamide adenosyltransferase [Candidatus Portnoybacteria bacterium]